MGLTVLHGHAKDLGGGFTVRRLLPDAQRRAVGPFVFFDHFGPVTLDPGVTHDVRPHPHIGLATFTYLFDGAIMHRDSLGTEQLITPGAINWMTAGRGIVHSERRPEALRDGRQVNHGLQLWLALPSELEACEPSFQHVAAADIPEWRLDGASARVLAGEAFGLASPVRAASRTLALDIQLAAGAALTLPALVAEMALLPIDGAVAVDGEAVAASALALLPPGRAVTLTAHEAVRVVVLGGDPLDGPRHLWWNFVASRAERVAEAAADWQAQRMGQIAGETEFIPLPTQKLPV